jgi:hypothetical protein
MIVMRGARHLLPAGDRPRGAAGGRGLAAREALA